MLFSWLLNVFLGKEVKLRKRQANFQDRKEREIGMRIVDGSV